MITRAAIYARVSSQAQRESQTIESQLRVLPAFVKAQGWLLVDTYIDDGRSARAGKLDKREGFARLLKDAHAGRFDVLVVIDIDRLTRTDDMQERAAILGPFQAAGIRIVTPSGGELDLRTMIGELYVTLQAVFAAEENRKRAERTKRGLLRAAENGHKPNGWTPYGLGYDRATKEWSLNPEHARIVREIFRRVIAGDSCKTIADDLRARGEPSQTGIWHDHLVWRIVTARYPVGEWLANTRFHVVVRVPPIVDEVTWQRAQQAVTSGKQRGLRRTRHIYLLEALATCGECGGKICIQTADGGRHPARYYCRERRLGKGCKAPSALVAEIDAAVWDSVLSELQDPRLAKALAKRADERSGNRKAWEKDAAKYKADLARLTKAEQAFLARYRKGMISDDALDVELAALRKERAFTAEQLQTAERAVTGDREGAIDPAAYIAAMTRLAESGTPEDRRRVVQSIVKRAEVENKCVTITMRFRAVQAESLVEASACRTHHEYTIKRRVVAYA